MKQPTLVYARVIAFENNIKCRTCGAPLVPGSEARLEIALDTEVPCKDSGVVCVRCFGQMQRGEQIPDSLLR